MWTYGCQETVNGFIHACCTEWAPPGQPLRVVVQVLSLFFFFEEVKASAGVRSLNNNNNSGDASRFTTIAENCRALKKQMSQMRIKGDELRKNGKLAKKNSKNSRSGMQLLPSRSR
jgi:hypothetical protein